MVAEYKEKRGIVKNARWEGALCMYSVFIGRASRSVLRQGLSWGRFLSPWHVTLSGLMYDSVLRGGHIDLIMINAKTMSPQCSGKLYSLMKSVNKVGSWEPRQKKLSMSMQVLSSK